LLKYGTKVIPNEPQKERVWGGRGRGKAEVEVEVGALSLSLFTSLRD
jgi:hypothetical protein